MDEAFRERCLTLAEEMSWTIARAEGYVDGEIYKRQGLELPAYHKMAMDEYSKGFRTGYYKQAHSIPSDDASEATATA